MHRMFRSMKSRSRSGPFAAALPLVLLAGVALTAGCGEVNIETSGYKATKEKIKQDVKAEILAELGGEYTSAGPVVSDSSCVSCHTDKERLKIESAGIKRPKGSALTSGKG